MDLRHDLAWAGVESNQFGTDEFLKWCEIVGTEPYFALNFGTGMSLIQAMTAQVVAVAGV